MSSVPYINSIYKSNKFQTTTKFSKIIIIINVFGISKHIKSNTTKTHWITIKARGLIPNGSNIAGTDESSESCRIT